MGVIVDEAAFFMYANRAEQTAEFIGICIDRYASAVRDVLGPGRGLHDDTLETRLLEMAAEAERTRAAIPSVGGRISAAIRSMTAETAEADQFVWQDGGFEEAAAAFSSC